MPKLVQVRPHAYQVMPGLPMLVPALHFQFKEDEEKDEYGKVVIGINKSLFFQLEKAAEHAPTRKSFYADSESRYIILDEVPIFDALTTLSKHQSEEDHPDEEPEEVKATIESLVEAVKITATMYSVGEGEAH